MASIKSQKQTQMKQKKTQQQYCQPFELQWQKSSAGIVFGLLLASTCAIPQIEDYEISVDYPTYAAVPKNLSFECQDRLPGYYADTETRCQVWHWCVHSGHQYSFICPNGTVFNQAVRVCDWWTNVNCPASEQLYENNEQLYSTMKHDSDQRDNT